MLKTKSIDIQAIDHIVIRAHNLSRMTAFYCDVLGCEVERKSDKYKLVQLRAGKSLIDLMEVSDSDDDGDRALQSPTAHNMDHFCVQIAPWNEKALQDHLNLHSVKFGNFGNRYGALGEVPALYLSDPEGNTVELMGPPDHE
jgi:glyoxylase I family protein